MRLAVGAVLLLISTSACVSVQETRAPRNQTSQGLVAEMGPCAYENAGGEALATSLALGAASKGLDLFIGALKEAADPEKGKATSTANASMVIGSDGKLPDCLYLAKGPMSVFAGRREAGPVPSVSYSSSAPQADENRAETPAPISDDGNDVAPGVELPGTGTNPGETATTNQTNSTIYSRTDDFEDVGLYFADTPDLVAVFALDRTEGNTAIRLRPVYASYLKQSKGALFRFDKERDLAVTMKLSTLEGQQIALGPVLLGRLMPHPNSLVIFSTHEGALKRSLTASPWVKLPEKTLDQGSVLNAEVTLVEVQAPNRMAGYVGEVLEGSREELDNEIKLAIDSDAAKAASLEKLKAQATLSNAYMTAVVTACNSTDAARKAYEDQASGLLAALAKAENEQRLANIAAIEADNPTEPFAPVLSARAPSSSTLNPAICDSPTMVASE